jgi:hypothetical protein
MDGTSRPDPPKVAGEKETLLGQLEFQRATLLWKCDGLTPEQAGTRAVEPSILSLHGLVRHLTEVEIALFAQTIAGEETQYLYSTDAHPDGDWENLDPASYHDDMNRYFETVERSRRIAASYEMDHQSDFRGTPVTVRWAVTHAIQEYARHLGHADLIRERIDGATGH